LELILRREQEQECWSGYWIPGKLPPETGKGKIDIGRASLMLAIKQLSLKLGYFVWFLREIIIGKPGGVLSNNRQHSRHKHCRAVPEDKD